MKLPAYGIPLMDSRKAGERIGLLVVSVHDWEEGQDLEIRPNVARVVVPADTLPHQLDWSCAVALDCLVCGGCAESAFYSTALMLMEAHAASVWGVFADGIHRIEKTDARAYKHGLICTDDPVPAARFPLVLKAFRLHALMLRDGVYGTTAYDAARAAAFDEVFGPLSEKAQTWVAEKRGLPRLRAA